MSGYNYYLCRVVPSFSAGDQLSDATTLPLPSGFEIVERLRAKFPSITSDGVHGGWLDLDGLMGSFSILDRALSFSRIEIEDLRTVCDVLDLVAFDPRKVRFLFVEDGWPNKTMEPTRSTATALELLSPMQQEARAFAVEAHADQQYGEHPYSYHLDQVAELARPYGDEAVVIAYLHDTVEDTEATLSEIESRFGSKVAACVSLLTDEPGVNRKERKAKTYAKLTGVTGPNEIALLVKAADRLANVRACVKDRKQSLWELYRSEQVTFRAAAYRPGLCDPLWSELEALLSAGAFDSAV